MELTEEINRLKAERQAIIVAHNYQVDDVQEIADYTGDSYFLSKICAKNEAKTIVFCGVRFMAESAKLLSPEKTVLLPEATAGCPMADSMTPEDVIRLKNEHPKAAVVCYINSTVDVKAECDVCCTSSNALKVIHSLKEEEVIFIPDPNLGDYVSKQVPEKKFYFFNGPCVTHSRVSIEEIKKARKLSPGAPIAVHPECPPEVVAAADYVGSTSGIVDFCRNSDAKCIVIGTEMGILYQLKKDCPDKEFRLLTPRLLCVNMKKTSLESVYHALRDNKTQIEINSTAADKARLSLERMLRA